MPIISVSDNEKNRCNRNEKKQPQQQQKQTNSKKKKGGRKLLWNGES